MIGWVLESDRLMSLNYPKLQKDWELAKDRGLPVSRLTFNIKWKRITEEFAGFIKKACGKKKLVLDIGGGDGSFYPLIKELCSLYIAIEPSEKMIRKFQHSENKYICYGYGEATPCRSKISDIIVLNSVLDHCFDPNRVLSEAGRVLRPGGNIFILLANEGAWYKSLFRGYNVNKKMKSDEHNFYFNSDEIKRMLEKEGFADILIKYFDFLRLPIFIENILFFLVPKKLLLFFINITDRSMGLFFPCRGGSFICMATNKLC